MIVRNDFRCSLNNYFPSFLFRGGIYNQQNIMADPVPLSGGIAWTIAISLAVIALCILILTVILLNKLYGKSGMSNPIRHAAIDAGGGASRFYGVLDHPGAETLPLGDGDCPTKRDFGYGWRANLANPASANAVNEASVSAADLAMPPNDGMPVGFHGAGIADGFNMYKGGMSDAELAKRLHGN